MKYKVEMTMEINLPNKLSEAGIEDYIGENLNQNNISVEVDALQIDDPNDYEFEMDESSLKKFHDHCYTQTCTMNHMDNTDWERGYIAGVNFGRSMAERFFSNYKEETK